MLKKLQKAFFFWFAAEVLLIGVHFLCEIPVFKGFSLEHMIVSDFSLNDLHYRIFGKIDEKRPNLSGKIILVNTGCLQPDTVRFRMELAKLIAVLNNLQPAAIAIDHEFRKYAAETDSGTAALQKEVSQNPRIILGRNLREKSSLISLGLESNYANANFPSGQFTIRKYYSDTGTLAFKLAHKLEKNIAPPGGSDFFIHYLAASRDYFSLDDPEMSFLTADPDMKFRKFLLLPADSLLHLNQTDLKKFMKICRGKALMLGHFGTAGIRDFSFDSEDKHAVPNDTIHFYNRQNSMPGMMIHAIAAENILNPDLLFNDWSSTVWYKILCHLLFFIYVFYLLHSNLGKGWNIAILALLSFPYLYLILFLMQKGIYIETGLTLVALIVLEEVIESLESFYHTLKIIWRKKTAA